MSGIRVSQRRGFTLIEVLVALVIVAVAVAAVLGALTTAANSAIYLRDKTFASWIGLNKLTELRLAVTRPASGKSDGVIEYGGRQWQWQQEIADSQIPGLKRVDVRVRPLSDVGKAGPGATISEKTSWTAETSGMLGANIAPTTPNEPLWEPPPTLPGTGPGGAPGTGTGIGPGGSIVPSGNSTG